MSGEEIEVGETIWGSFPAPSANEVAAAWEQILQRVLEDATTKGTDPTGRVNRVRLDELLCVAPALMNHMDLLGRRYAEAKGSAALSEAYTAGVVDFIEVIGTVALNRYVQKMEASLPLDESEPEA